MTGHAEVKEFTFHYVVGGNATGFRKSKGTIGDKALVLGEDRVPYENIVETVTRGNRVVVVLHDFHAKGNLAKHLVDGTAVILETSGAKAVEIAIDRKCAHFEAQRRRAELVAKGLEHMLRTEQCPTCNVSIDLSGLEVTPYTYCRFCESLFTRKPARVTNGEKYRICDECGMFDRIQEYPEFYFYFLLVVYGFSYKQRFLCDGCAHGLFMKALFLNLLFILGVPTAIWVKIKSIRGRDNTFALLARANSLARAGRYQEASRDYAGVLLKHPNHPAVLMNQALAFAAGGNQKDAGKVLERSLAACNHYVPVLRLLQS